MRRYDEPKAWASLIACFLALGCGKEPPTESIAFENEGFTYAVMGGAELCAGAPERAQSEIVELSDWFGVGVTGVRYNLYEGKDSLRDFAPCSHYAGGCFSEGIVYTTTGADTHELVHAVAAALGQPPRFLAEGAAVMFSESFGSVDTQTVPKLIGSFDVVRLCTDEGWNEAVERDVSTLYRTAGAFARFIVEEYGRERYVDLYSRLARGRPETEVRETFEDVFAVRLEDLLARWDAWDFLSTETVYRLTRGTPVLGSEDAATLTSSCGVSWGRDFEHDSSRRTLLHFRGEPQRSVSIDKRSGGSASGGLRLVLPKSGELLVILDGPSAAFRAQTQFYGPPAELSIEQLDLDAELELKQTPAVVVSASAEKHAPVCFSSAVEVGEIGTTIVGPGVFVTGLPLAMQCCAGDECTEMAMWPDGSPGTATCPSGCIVPSQEFPTEWQSVPAASSVGRRLVYGVNVAQ